MNKKHKKWAKGKDTSEHHEPLPDHLSGEVRMIYTVRIQPAPDDAKKYADEHEHRINQLDAGKWLNIISAAGVVVAFLAVAAASVYASIAYRQLTVMQNAAITDERAWIFPDATGWGFINYGTEKAAAKITFRNTGKTWCSQTRFTASPSDATKANSKAQWKILRSV